MTIKLLDAKRYRLPCGLHVHHAVFVIAIAEILLCLCGLVGLILLEVSPKGRLWPYSFLVMDVCASVLLIYGNQTKQRHSYWPYMFIHIMFIALNTYASLVVFFSGLAQALGPAPVYRHMRADPLEEQRFNVFTFVFFGGLCVAVNALLAYLLWTVFRGYKYLAEEKLHHVSIYFPKLSTFSAPPPPEELPPA